MTSGWRKRRGQPEKISTLPQEKTKKTIAARNASEDMELPVLCLSDRCHFLHYRLYFWVRQTYFYLMANSMGQVSDLGRMSDWDATVSNCLWR